jgi:hypothetical protein
MTALDQLIPRPRLVEIDRVDLGAPATAVWERLRHGALGHSRLTRTLFALRTLASRHEPSARPPGSLRLDDLVSSPATPGFQILIDDPPRELAVGAIGQVWRPNIPFVHVVDADAFSTFAGADYVKVAWALRVSPLPGSGSHVELEVRVAPTSARAWRRFRAYFLAIGPASRYIRRSLLRALVRDHGMSTSTPYARSFPGDERLPDAAACMTHTIDVAAEPDAVWPWIVQMGCRRAGFYSVDLLDNGGRRSARELHPEWQTLEIGKVIPATPDRTDGFEVLAVDPPHALTLGTLYDVAGGRQVPFASPRPPQYWQVTWTFLIEALDGRSTRISVRARAAFSPERSGHARWMRAVHDLMQTSQLRNLARRVEGRLPRDDWRDVLHGLGGAAQMAGGLSTPFRRADRAHWGLDAAAAARSLPGDQIVAHPRWTWTHGIEIDAPASVVWPWVAQIGADRAGFYSYQWLENLAGCGLRNAETVHPEWAVHQGDTLLVHPKMPPLQVAEAVPGRYFVAHAPPDPAARATGKPWVAVSWLFLVESLGPHRCRFVSRYRAASSGDLATRLSFGPSLLEPIGFVMNRRMLQGVRRRAERSMAAMNSSVPLPSREGARERTS